MATLDHGIAGSRGRARVTGFDEPTFDMFVLMRALLIAGMITAVIGCGGGGATGTGGVGGRGSGGAGVGGHLGSGGTSGSGGASPSGGASGGGGVAGGGSGAAGSGAQGGDVGGRAGGGAGSAGHAGVGGAAGAGGAAGSHAGGRGGAGGGTSGMGGSGAGGAGGNPGTTYAGCTFIGAVNRTVIASMNTSDRLCVVLVLNSPGTNPYPGLTLPAGMGVEYAFAQSMPAGAQDCVTRNPPTNATFATGATGMVTLLPSPQPTANVDVTLSFPPTAVLFVRPTERLLRMSLLLPMNCP